MDASTFAGLQFLHFRSKGRIAGVETEVARVGMSGNLAYELHGPLSTTVPPYDAVYQAGQDLGVERLGWGWHDHDFPGRAALELAAARASRSCLRTSRHFHRITARHCPPSYAAPPVNS